MKFKSLDTASGNDVTVSTTYKSVNPLMANVIVGTDLLPGSDGNIVHVLGPDHYSGGYTGPAQTTVRLLGSIYYHVDGQAIGRASIGIRGSVNPNNVPAGVRITTITRNNLTLRRNAPAPSKAHDCPHDGSRSICDQGAWTDSTGTLHHGTHTTAQGNQPLSQFQGGLLQHQAQSQPASGAWIKYCYTAHGALDSNCQVFPWKMKSRIQEALRISGYDQKGGLDGHGETDIDALIARLTGTAITGSAPQMAPGPHPPGMHPPVTALPAPTNLRAILMP